MLVENTGIDPVTSRSATSYTEFLEITGYILPKLILSWPSLHILSNITNETYNLPKQLSLSWSQARFLRGVSKRQYCAVLLTKTRSGNNFALLHLPQRNWDHDPLISGHLNQ